MCIYIYRERGTYIFLYTNTHRGIHQYTYSPCHGTFGALVHIPVMGSGARAVTWTPGVDLIHAPFSVRIEVLGATVKICCQSGLKT